MKKQVSRNQGVKTQHIVTSERIHSGPLPAPQDFAGYNAVVPGAAERILKMAEDEAIHRRGCEHKKIAIESRNHLAFSIETLLGQVFAFSISLAAIYFGADAATKGAQWGGSIIGVAGLAGIVAAFINGRKR